MDTVTLADYLTDYCGVPPHLFGKLETKGFLPEIKLIEKVSYFDYELSEFFGCDIDEIGLYILDRCSITA